MKLIVNKRSYGKVNWLKILAKIDQIKEVREVCRLTPKNVIFESSIDIQYHIIHAVGTFNDVICQKETSSQINYF